MEIIKDISSVRAKMKAYRQAGKIIGFVPTMGFLHEGHLSLMRLALEKAEVLVVSVFVNPSQFAPHEDFDAYPRDFERDFGLLEQMGCHVVFTPTKDMMYPPEYRTWVTVDGLSQKLCGVSRPIFFRGVATIVTKLFNIIQPDLAVFGQKDAQQAIIIQRMVADLNLPVEIIVGPIVREPDGLAMSSRNSYLTAAERQDALVLSQSLEMAKGMLEAGGHSKTDILERMQTMIDSKETTRIDYIEMVDGGTLNDVDNPTGHKVLIALAVHVGTTRLIDNIVVDLR